MLCLFVNAWFRFFFFNDTATTEIYTLSLHDALPISRRRLAVVRCAPPAHPPGREPRAQAVGGDARPARGIRSAGRYERDRKSTRLNSSHSQISYAVFCLKKKNTFYSALNFHTLSADV